MKYLFIISLLLTLLSCKADEETLLVTSKVNCIVPTPVAESEIHYNDEDSITVTPIVQLR